MKKFVLLSLLALLFVRCSNSNKEQEAMPFGSHVVVIDSCEYISYGHGLAHKGNCKYCEERKKKYKCNGKKDKQGV